MRITRPCNRPEQLSFLSSESSCKRHRWKNGVCIHCALDKKAALINACDCGCRTPILKDTPTTQYGAHTFVFGHETLDMFEKKPIEMKQG
jgi:hypothetical protein